MYFREFLGVRDNESRLYSKTMTDLHSVFAYRSLESNALRPFLICVKAPYLDIVNCQYSRLSLSRNRRDPQKQFEISVLRHIIFVVLRKKQFEQPIFTNDYVI